MKEWKLVDHPDIPGMMLVEGPAFRVVICTQASNITFPEYRQIMTDARLMAAAPKMYELIEYLSQSYDDSKSSHELASTLYDLRCMALRLLGKIEGGGDGK